MFIMISIWQKNLRISEGASIKELMRITFEFVYYSLISSNSGSNGDRMVQFCALLVTNPYFYSQMAPWQMLSS